jgi:hypothetical protein
MHADCARSPDIERVAPEFELNANEAIRARCRDDNRTVDECQDRATLLRCNTLSRRLNVTQRYATELAGTFGTHRIVSRFRRSVMEPNCERDRETGPLVCERLHTNHLVFRLAAVGAAEQA